MKKVKRGIVVEMMKEKTFNFGRIGANS